MEDASSLAVVDPEWELIDPNPDIYALFTHFDAVYFGSHLTVVEVTWSKRMTSCAGICYFHPKNGQCIIRLSEPLLKLRPRRDLIETLLHEMIHAYLFVTNNNTDRDDHGPSFLQHMRRINAATGANVTVYHTFNEEVDSYKVHIWKCGGPCSKQHPYYGIVRRAMNRPPGMYDSWWSRHESTCGGVFLKIAGPKTRAELKAEKKKKRADKQHDSSLAPGTADAGLKIFKENIKNYFPVIDGKSSKIESLMYDAVEDCTEDYTDMQTRKNTEGVARGGYVWPGSGKRLGGTGLFPALNSTIPCATVTSGALLAEQRDRFGANEASYTSIHDHQFNNVSNVCKWNNDSAKNQTSTSQMEGTGVDRASNPRFTMDGGERARFGIATITPMSTATLPVISDSMGNLADGGKCAMNAAADLECIEREIALSLRNKEPIFQMSEEDRGRLLSHDSDLPAEYYEPFLAGNGFKIVDCPICSAKVPLPMINDHMDNQCRLTGTASTAAETDVGRRCLVCHIYLPGSMIEEHQQLCLKGVLTAAQPLGTEAGPSGIGGFGGGGIAQLANEETDSSDEEGPIVVEVVSGNIGQLVKCPVCGCQVLNSDINEHLDECAVI